jgi:ketosteroid isomerase-like protein
MVVDVGDDDDATAALVAAANHAFYRAFAEGDLDAMDEVWAHGPHVRCVHPGWAMLEGWDEVRDSWAQILDGPDADLDISIDDVQVRAGGLCGWVSCVERLIRGDLESEVVATNVFERDADGTWRLVQHHASPVLNRSAEVISGGDEVN